MTPGGEDEREIKHHVLIFYGYVATDCEVIRIHGDSDTSRVCAGTTHSREQFAELFEFSIVTLL